MALNGTTWGQAVASAVNTAITANSIQAGTPISDAQREAVWIAICTAHKTHINGSAAVTVPGVQTGGSTITNGTVQ